MTEHGQALAATANPIAAIVRQPIEAKPRADQLMTAAGSVPELITDHDTNGMVGDLIKQIRSHVRRLEDERKALTGPIGEGVRRINARFKQVTEPLNEAMKALGGRSTAFLQEQDRMARAKEERLRKEQDDAAQAQALAMERKATELKAQAEELDKAGNAALAEEKAAEAEHQTAQAEEVLEEGAEGIAPVVVNPKASRGDCGSTTSLRDNWKWELIDKGQVPTKFLIVDEKLLNKLVRQANYPFREIPGIRIYNEQIAVTR